jgi:hypothetical protein
VCDALISPRAAAVFSYVALQKKEFQTVPVIVQHKKRCQDTLKHISYVEAHLRHDKLKVDPESIFMLISSTTETKKAQVRVAIRPSTDAVSTRQPQTFSFPDGFRRRCGR